MRKIKKIDQQNYSKIIVQADLDFAIQRPLAKFLSSFIFYIITFTYCNVIINNNYTILIFTHYTFVPYYCIVVIKVLNFDKITLKKYVCMNLTQLLYYCIYMVYNTDFADKSFFLFFFFFNFMNRSLIKKYVYNFKLYIFIYVHTRLNKTQARR